MNSSRLLVLALVAAGLAALAPATALAKPKKPQPQYYLSLGDSLSVGVQPGPASDPGHQQAIANTSQGYTNQLYALAKRRYKNLELVAAGCGGATTESFISGGKDTTTNAPCNPLRKLPYASTSAKTSQLAYAETFLRKHRGHVAFVTVEIGNNDLDGCATGGGIDLQCVSTGTADIKRDLPVIGKRLRKAAGPRVPIVGATVYDPFLQSWFNGESGQGLAGASQSLAQSINQNTVIPAYGAANIDVAMIDEAFGTYTPLTQVNAQGLPIAVANVCTYTWMCAPAPIGPNIHATTAGYGVMAKAFLAALPSG
jgi:lysophospholipase L1-like esterase